MSDNKERKQTADSSSDGSTGSTSGSQKSPEESTGPSNVSYKSDQSIGVPYNFREDIIKWALRVENNPQSLVASVPQTETQNLEGSQELSSCSVSDEVLRDSVNFLCGHQSYNQSVSSAWEQPGSPAERLCPKCQTASHKDREEETGNTLILEAQKSLKKEMQSKLALVSEGNGDQHSSLQSIYTTLYITTGETEGPNGEHELEHLKHKLKKQSSSDCSVNLNNIFKLMPDQEKPHRTVLTKGVAGIGKSFAVQKVSLDWAKEEGNQDVDFVISLAFRELNLSKGDKNLYELFTESHPALRLLKDSDDFAQTKIIVILDGLNESRLQLDFKNMKTVSSLRDVTSVGNLLVNLIQGNLLPDAKLWITSRPAAANQIPAEYIDMVTEIRGFTDSQKVEYFNRRFSEDLSLAERITSHIQSSQSLNIMCQIPIFCWISAVLFQEVFGGDEETEIPQTLTEMMAHFLFAQTKRRNRNYDKTEKSYENPLITHREFLLKLGRLAFVHLQENKLIFYEEDLENHGIDIKEASIYSGFFNTVLREERVFSQKQIFFFVHLTVQEFFAALYIYECFTSNRTEGIKDFLNLKEEEEHSLLDLVKMAVGKVLDKKNVHLDWFLRFLLGLMVEPNRRVLQGLLESHGETNEKILTYLRSLRRKTLSPDSCINLFQTMVEMRDHKVKDEIQEYLKMSDRSESDLTPLHCSALAYMLQVSKDNLDTLDMKSYNTTDEGRRRLIPAVRSSKRAVFANCRVTPEWVDHLVVALKFSYSALIDLDLSNNDLKDSGVKLLCDGLSSHCCKLEKLWLSGCMVTEEGCTYLLSALQSNPSHLVELDLSYNHPGDAGEKLLSDLRDRPQYKLRKLNFDHGGDDRIKPGFRKYACELTLNPRTTQKNLVLSEGNREVTWMEEDPLRPHHTGRPEQQLVLCEQGLTGRHYWEVEAFGPCSIGVTCRGADRMGLNQSSWCLVCSDDGSYVLHNNSRVGVSSSSLERSSSRVGVYLDWPAGTLSFYRVPSDSQTVRLHSYRTAFSEPLYPAVSLHPQSKASLHQLM